jgi:hypothetical protein
LHTNAGFAHSTGSGAAVAVAPKSNTTVAEPDNTDAVFCVRAGNTSRRPYVTWKRRNVAEFSPYTAAVPSVEVPLTADMFAVPSARFSDFRGPRPPEAVICHFGSVEHRPESLFPSSDEELVVLLADHPIVTGHPESGVIGK